MERFLSNSQVHIHTMNTVGAVASNAVAYTKVQMKIYVYLYNAVL